MTALATLIADLQADKYPSYQSSPLQIIPPTPDFIAALQEIQSFIEVTGPYLPLAGGTMTGAIGVIDGSPAAPAIQIHAANNGFYYEPSDPLTAVTLPNSFSAGGAFAFGISSSGINSVHVGGALSFRIAGEGGTATNTRRYTNDNAGPGYTAGKARGTIAAPAVGQLNDVLGNYDFTVWSGSTFSTSARTGATLIETGTVSSTAIGGQLTLSACAIGSGTLTEIARWNTASGLQMFGGNTVVDANRLLRGRVFTVATLPAVVNGARAQVSDSTVTLTAGIGLVVVGGGANSVPVNSDAANWRIG